MRGSVSVQDVGMSCMSWRAGGEGGIRRMLIWGQLKMLKKHPKAHNLSMCEKRHKYTKSEALYKFHSAHPVPLRMYKCPYGDHWHVVVRSLH